MNYRCFVLAFLGCLAIHPVAAQVACAAQIVPIKPIAMLTCTNAAPVCMTDANGFNGHWAWMCPAAPRTSGFGLLDPAVIVNGVQPAQIESPLNVLQRVEQLRQMKLQNEIQQQQLLEMQRKAASQSPAAPSSDSVERSSPENLEAINLGLKQGHTLQCETETIGQDAIGVLTKMTCTILIDRK